MYTNLKHNFGSYQQASGISLVGNMTTPLSRIQCSFNLVLTWCIFAKMFNCAGNGLWLFSERLLIKISPDQW